MQGSDNRAMGVETGLTARKLDEAARHEKRHGLQPWRF
jgi:hypothetical protein